jgi:hypothetical protein
LLLLSGISQAAEDADLINAVNARLAQLQTEVWQLDDAIYKLGNMHLSDTQKYELIAEQSFSETEKIVFSYGLTLKQLYTYEATHQQALEAWLQEHPGQVDQIDVLEDEIMQLQLQFDQLILPGSG